MAAMCFIDEGSICCFPKQIEGYLDVTFLFTDSDEPFMKDSMLVSADIQEQKLRLSRPEYSDLYLFKEQKAYTFGNGFCSTYNPGQWAEMEYRFCVPDKANASKSYTLGTDYPLILTDYEFTVNLTETVLFSVVRTVTNQCIPVTEFTKQSDGQGSSLIARYMYKDVTLGIKDPHVFDVPAICSNAAKGGGKHLRTMDPFLKTLMSQH